MKTRRYLILFLAALLTFAACDKTPVPTPVPPDDDKDANVTLDCSSFVRYATDTEIAVFVTPTSGTTFTASVPSEYDWISVESVGGADAGFVHFSLKNNTSGVTRSATVKIEYGSNKSKPIEIRQYGRTRQQFFEEWGIQGETVNYVSNERPYEWYIDQGNTGPCSGVNCGPSSVTMACNWYDGSLQLKASEARNVFYNNGGWWYTTDITAYMNLKKVKWHSAYITESSLKAEMDNGNIAILCLDMYYISAASGIDSKVGKFYSTQATGWGHFIVVKGYVETKKGVYFEVYDPYSLNRSGDDGLPRGRDCYYKSADIIKATGVWHTTMYVAEK